MTCAATAGAARPGMLCSGDIDPVLYVSHELGLGFAARAEYWDAGPRPPPRWGARWPSRRDLPVVIAALHLPAPGPDWELVPELANTRGVRVFGERLWYGWGIHLPGEPTRYRAHTYVYTRTSEALAAAQRDVAAAVERVRAVLKARAVRLAARETTLAAARSGEPIGLRDEETP